MLTLFPGALIVGGGSKRYTDGIDIGIQAGDYLEHPYPPAGIPNRMFQADFDRCVAAGITFFRIPANLSTAASLDGVVPLTRIEQILDQGRMAAKALTDAGKPIRVIYDPNHHNIPRKGDFKYIVNWPKGVQDLTQAQHGQRDTAFMTQFAKAIKDHDLGFSIDLFNEPGGAITLEILNAWHADVVSAIRSTGGNNASRMLWLETLGDNYRGLIIPPGGNVGVSPHNYWPFAYTHNGAVLSDAGLAAYQAQVRLFKLWAEAQGVDYFIGEAGVKGTAAERPEYIAHICNVARRERVATCLWDYATAFGLADQKTREWKPGMLDALAGTFKVRAYPEPRIVDTTQGILMPNAYGATFKDGTLTVPAFPTAEKKEWRFFTVLFPKAPFSRAGRITPEVQTPLLIQVMGYKPGAKAGEYEKALQKADGKPIASGYRAPSGVPIETPGMEAGAFIAAYIEQPMGSPAVAMKLAPGWSV